MIIRNDLAVYLEELLSCAAFHDYAPNGLQIEGKLGIKKIATAVTASLAVIEQAIDAKADAILVHHGYFWKGEKPNLTGMKKKRIEKLLAHEINLFAYHLPLDCHKELGNNACLGQLLQIGSPTMHTVSNTVDLLWSGLLEKSLNANDLAEVLTKKLGQKPLHIASTKPVIQRIAWCTGAAQDFIMHAADLGVDAYISGEISERTFYQAQELDLHYFACGHHATERYGIQALGRHLAKAFDLTEFYIDSPNPV